MGTWTNVYTWLLSVVGSPPTPINTGSGYSTTWNPAEVIAYATACLIVLFGFKILFWIVRRCFGGAS